jgi:hypothetical protein
MSQNSLAGNFFGSMTYAGDEVGAVREHCLINFDCPNTIQLKVDFSPSGAKSIKK